MHEVSGSSTGKEGNVLFMSHSTHFIYSHMASDHSGRKDGNVLFNDIHLVYGYMASDVW